jgi:hypothetical protein
MNIASELRPHDLFCIITESHADIFAARAVCEGHFQEAGETVTMSMPPRWLGPHLPPDQEWRIAWHKFYFGLDLSHAFAVTGERRFLDVWLQLVLSFIDQIPPGSESDCHVTSRRILNWIYAWVRFASTAEFPGLGAQVAERLVESIGRQAHHVRRNLSPKLNHRTIELTAIFHTALALPIVDPDQSLLQFSLAALDESLKQDILDDGVHRERSTHYHMITLRNFLGCRLNGQRYGAVFPPGFDERLERACEFALHCHRPDGGIPAFSDSDGGSYLDLLGLAADLFQRTDFRYSATRGKSGNPPRDGASFVHGGYFTQRSSWNQPEESFADARHLVWDCGSVGEGGHGHYDALHFELAAGGKPLLIDPGRFTYSEASPNWRRWFKGTSAHNTICVDGLDQTPYDSWNVGGVSSRQARAQFLGRWSVEGLDMLRGVVGSHCYCAKHQRTILFITGEYWLVEDSVTDTLSHTYDLRFHLSPSATGNTVVSKRGDCCVVQSPGLTLLSMGGDALRLEDGWFAPKYGVKEPAPVISIEKKDSNAKFVTLLFPTFSGNKVVRFVHNKEESCGGRSSVEIQWKNSCASFNDSVIWSDFVTELQIGPNRAKGVAAWSRQDLNGAAQKFVAASELTVGPEKS